MERDIAEGHIGLNLNAKRLVGYFKGAPLIPGIILLTMAVAGTIGVYFAPHDPTASNLADTLLPPFWQKGGSLQYILGTDHLGRDVLSRLIAGSRISLEVGVFGVLLGAAVGTAVALVSGYFGGWIDAILSRLSDAMLSIPYLMLALVLAVVLGPSIRNVILVLALVTWAQYARLLRGEVLRLKNADFVKLAVVGGAGKTRIMITHILPNITNTLVTTATLQFGVCILYEASLSFLGMGVPPPNSSWGLMLSEGRAYITLSWWLCVFPGIAISLVILASNLFGDWLRIRLDPKFRQR